MSDVPSDPDSGAPGEPARPHPEGDDAVAYEPGEVIGPSPGGSSEPLPPLRPETRRALEAIIMVAADPVLPQMLAQLLEVSVDRIDQECLSLAAHYEAEDRGFVLVRVAGGYRYQSHPDAAPYVERYVLEGQSARLSNAALETLAIVAYKQPLSRAQVASIRGVNVDGVMRTLTQRGLVAEVARDPGPGQAVLYGTTPLFLERLGLNALDDLPPIAAFVPGADVVEALETSLRVTSEPDAPPADADTSLEDDDGPAVPPERLVDLSDETLDLSDESLDLSEEAIDLSDESLDLSDELTERVAEPVDLTDDSSVPASDPDLAAQPGEAAEPDESGEAAGDLDLLGLGEAQDWEADLDGEPDD